MATPAIQIIGLRRSFGRVCAVENLTLSVPRESIFALLGPNGSGKTTTIRIALGLTRADAGLVYVFGQPVQRRRSPGTVGALLSQPPLYDHLTVYENVKCKALLLDLPERRIPRTLELVGLQDHHRQAKALSTGERQRLAFALALVGEPALLILDEPDAGLDPEAIITTRELILAARDRSHSTVLLSTHLLNEVDKVSSHVAILKAGRLVFSGPMQSLLQLGPRRVLIRASGARVPELATQLGWFVANTVTPHLLCKPHIDDQDVADLIKMLVVNGVDIYDIMLSTPTVESAYSQLTSQPS